MSLATPRRSKYVDQNGAILNAQPAVARSSALLLLSSLLRRKLVMVVVIGLAFLMCPTERDFVAHNEYVRGRISSNLAKAAQLLGIQKDSYHYVGLAAIARSQEGHLYLGAFGMYLQMPDLPNQLHLPQSPEEELQVLIGLNIVIWLLWGILGESWLAPHFTAGWHNMWRRPWCFWTAAISHKGFFHLLYNMLSLWALGLPLRQTIPGDSFYLLLGTAAFAGSAASICWNHGYLNRCSASLGASGLLNAILACSLAISQRGRFFGGGAKIQWFSFELTPWQALGANLVVDVLLNIGTGVDVACHVGGAAAGWYFGSYML